MMKPLPSPYSPLFAISWLLFVTITPIIGDDKTPANGDDWLTYYYRDPRPDQLVAQLKAWSSEGTLQDDNARAPLTGFLSQVFRQNTDQIENWYSRIIDLPKADLQFITIAIWMANTKESKRLLKEKHPGVFDENVLFLGSRVAGVCGREFSRLFGGT